jgi:SAM-dependent methyltransferase
MRLLRPSARHECPVCGARFTEFLPYNTREHAQCPRCKVLERHRLEWVLLDRVGVLSPAPAQIAHFAPEPGVAKRFRKLPAPTRYRTADLMPGRADEVIDVQAIPWEDGSIDLLICDHVLEHVPDDRVAMRELARVLADDGVAMINVPLTKGVTEEDPSVTDPSERLRRFGQDDHVRRYGQDFYDRMAEAGLHVTLYDVRDLATPEERERYGLQIHSPWHDLDDAFLWVLPLFRKTA